MTYLCYKGGFFVLTFKERENIIRRYGNDYKKSKIIEIKGLDILAQNSVFEKESLYMNLEKYQYYYALQDRIDRILEQMDYDHANFIKQEFLSNNYRSDWWMSFFSRSTYYRIKRKSMDCFLELMYA